MSWHRAAPPCCSHLLVKQYCLLFLASFSHLFYSFLFPLVLKVFLYFRLASGAVWCCFVGVPRSSVRMAVQRWPRPPSPCHAFLCQMHTQRIANHWNDEWFWKRQVTPKSSIVQEYTKLVRIYIYNARHGGHRACNVVSLSCQVNAFTRCQYLFVCARSALRQKAGTVLDGQRWTQTRSSPLYKGGLNDFCRLTFTTCKIYQMHQTHYCSRYESKYQLQRTWKHGRQIFVSYHDKFFLKSGCVKITLAKGGWMPKAPMCPNVPMVA